MELIFSIFGDLLNPQLFSKLVKLSATNSWLKGEPVPNQSNMIRKETAWELSTGFIQTLYLEEVIDIFLQKIHPHIDDIINYAEINNLEIKIYLVVEIYFDQEPALYFTKQFIKLAARFNCEIDIDLYVFKNEIDTIDGI